MDGVQWPGASPGPLRAMAAALRQYGRVLTVWSERYVDTTRVLSGRWCSSAAVACDGHLKRRVGSIDHAVRACTIVANNLDWLAGVVEESWERYSRAGDILRRLDRSDPDAVPVARQAMRAQREAVRTVDHAAAGRVQGLRMAADFVAGLDLPEAASVTLWDRVRDGIRPVHSSDGGIERGDGVEARARWEAGFEGTYGDRRRYGVLDAEVGADGLVGMWADGQANSTLERQEHGGLTMCANVDGEIGSGGRGELVAALDLGDGVLVCHARVDGAIGAVGIGAGACVDLGIDRIGLGLSGRAAAAVGLGGDAHCWVSPRRIGDHLRPAAEADAQRLYDDARGRAARGQHRPTGAPVPLPF